MGIEDIKLGDIFVYDDLKYLYIRGNCFRYDGDKILYNYIKNDKRFVKLSNGYLNTNELDSIEIYTDDSYNSFKLKPKDANITFIDNSTYVIQVSNNDINTIQAIIRNKKLNELLNIIGE